METKLKTKKYVCFYKIAWLLIIPAFIVLAVGSILDKSATYDEGIILSSGLNYLKNDSTDVNPENPPLGKSLLAFPLFFKDTKVPEVSEKLKNSYSMNLEFEYGKKFLYSLNNPEKTLFSARFANIIITAFCGIMLFFILRLFFSKWLSLTGMALFLFEPNIIANGRIATIDMSVVLFSLLCIYYLFYVLRQKSYILSIICGIALGFALLCKFTAVLLLPAVLIIFIIFCFKEKNFKSAKFAVTGFVLILISALLTVNIVYGFNGFGKTLSSSEYKSPIVRTFSENAFFNKIPVPLPESYLRGFDIVGYNNRPGFPNVFLGEFYQKDANWWYYYFVIAGLKIPLPLLFMFIIGLFTLTVKYYKKWYFWFWMIFPLIIFINFSFIAHRQLGIRYLLPLFPFCFIPLVYFLRKLYRKNSIAHKTLATAFICLCFLDTAIAFPDYLSYANSLAGGPDAGAELLSDSNYDWGQDLPALRQWLDEKGNPPIFLAYHGTADPEYYAIYNSEKPKYAAVSVTSKRIIMKDPSFSKKFRKIVSGKPFAKAGKTIYIYKLSEQSEQ